MLSRNAFTGLRFDRGNELFQIADLSHVWVLTDAFDGEAQYFKPGMVARLIVPRQNHTPAKVSNSVPQFDATSRTLKVRLGRQPRDRASAAHACRRRTAD